MSRVGKRPVVIPSGVKVDRGDQKLSVRGPKGKLDLEVHPRIKMSVENGQVHVNRSTDIRTDRALHGLMRSLVQNMMLGVTQGFSKELEIVGVGYRAHVKEKTLSMQLGRTHPIAYEIPEGVEVRCPNPTRITVSGPDKQRVGQVAADIRKFCPPEPYKGKGIHYVGEQIRRKQGKKVG